MARQSWREQTFLFLKSNTIYCSNIFAKCTESTKFITFLYEVKKCENILTVNEGRFLPNAQKTDRWLQTP
jgi:hypothetical protein